MVSKSHRTILEDGAQSYDEQMEEPPVMGFIWQDELIKDRKKREWRAFYAGCIIGTMICAMSVIFLIELTGGCK